MKCIIQVTVLYDHLKTVVTHFQLSNRSKEQLDAAMSILEMTKGVYLISWYATRMAHFLTACGKFNDLLVPIYTTMYTSGLKKEDRDALFTTENIYTMKVIVGVEKTMYGHYLRQVDKSANLVSMTYRIAHSAADKVRDIATEKADKFLASLDIDDKGNLNFTEVKILTNELFLTFTRVVF